MEASAVSPPPASPTEAEDPCEIDVSNVAIHSVTLLISLSGLLGNGAVLCLLRLKCPNSSIFVLAVFDFLFLLFMAPSALLLLVEDVSCSTIMPLLYFSILSYLSVVSFYLGLLQLSYFSIVTDMDKLCRLCCRCRLPEHLLRVVGRVQLWCLLALVFVIFVVILLCPSDKKEHCRVALIPIYAIILLIFAAPTVISRSIDFIKAMCGSQQQQLKKHDIAVFSFSLFSLILTLCSFLQLLGYIAVPSQVLFLLACIHSTIKPFIYFFMGRCWRHSSVGSLRNALQRVFEEPEENAAHNNDVAMGRVA